MSLISIPYVFSPNTTASSSQVNANFSTIANDYNGGISATNLAAGAVTTAKIADSNVTTAKIADSNVTTAKIADDAVTDAKMDYPRFWQEVARTTLTVAGDTISVTSIPARKYYLVLGSAEATGGTLDTQLRFNNDSGSNYIMVQSANMAAGASTGAVSAIAMESGATDSGGLDVFEMQIFNYAAGKEKSYMINSVSHDAAGATVPTCLENMGKWINTSALISRIDWINAGTGDFAIGSEVVVLGHD